MMLCPHFRSMVRFLCIGLNSQKKIAQREPGYLLMEQLGIDDSSLIGGVNIGRVKSFAVYTASTQIKRAS
jgi:hypothetical protein